MSLDERKEIPPICWDDCLPCWNACRKRPIPGIKTTIKNRYFDSANAMPSVVLPGHHEAWPEPSE